MKLVEVSLAAGAIRLKVPATWKASKPRSRIVEREFAIPKVGDELNGRLTMMRSGGSVKMNVERWLGQFAQPDPKKKTADVAKVTSKEINGQKVTLVDIPGTFTETMGGGPFAPGKTIKREGYRMLGGIVQTKATGQYFFKLYGPQKTVKSAEKHFLAMMDSVETGNKKRSE